MSKLLKTTSIKQIDTKFTETKKTDNENNEYNQDNEDNEYNEDNKDNKDNEDNKNIDKTNAKINNKSNAKKNAKQNDIYKNVILDEYIYLKAADLNYTIDAIILLKLKKKLKAPVLKLGMLYQIVLK